MLRTTHTVHEMEQLFDSMVKAGTWSGGRGGSGVGGCAS